MYKILLLTLFFCSGVLFAGKPSWKVYGLFIDGIKTNEEVAFINQAILNTDKKMIKSASGLSLENNFVLIDHDHHNTTFQKIAQNILNIGNYRIYTKMIIPDYKKVQGTYIGEKLAKVLNTKETGFTIKLVDESKGEFEVIMNAEPVKIGKGFNFGNLAHPISDPLAYGGLGLNMRFEGKNGKGGMVKDVVKKELAFRKKGKKTKKLDKELFKAHKEVFNFPPESLKKYYQ